MEAQSTPAPVLRAEIKPITVTHFTHLVGIVIKIDGQTVLADTMLPERAEALARAVNEWAGLRKALEASHAALVYHPGGDNRSEEDIQLAETALHVSRAPTPAAPAPLEVPNA